MQAQIKTKVEQTKIVFIENRFYKSGCTYFKVTDSCCLMVTKKNHFTDSYIRILSPDRAIDFLTDLEKENYSTADEFNAAFCEVHNEMAAIQLDQLQATA